MSDRRLLILRRIAISRVSVALAAATLFGIAFDGCDSGTPQSARDQTDLLSLIARSDSVTFVRGQTEYSINDAKEITAIKRSIANQRIAIIPNNVRRKKRGVVVFLSAGREIAIGDYFDKSVIAFRETYFQLAPDPFLPYFDR